MMITSPADEARVRSRARHLASRALGADLDVLLLFGSRARREASLESDWDVLALLHDEADAVRARSLLCEVTGRLAEETGEQVNFKSLRWKDANNNAALIKTVAIEGVRL